jgi:acetolactate synthase-1/2/3 large subunit
MKVAQALVNAIKKEGITHVFMVPGGIVDTITEELSRTPEITTFITAHEGGAIAMADGYARAGGKFGVAMCISGPGIMNMMTGIYTAYMDRSPILIISGEVPTAWEGRGSFQDTSPNGAVHDGDILRTITSTTRSLRDTTNLEFHLRAVFKKMLSYASMGPAHLALPVNVQNAETSYEHESSGAEQRKARLLDPDACGGIAELIANSARIAIICGASASDSDMNLALPRFAEKYHIPVATTFSAKGAFPEDHPLSLGYFGWSGLRTAIGTILSDQLEVLIVLGSRLNMQDTLYWNDRFATLKAIIQVDADENNIAKNFPAQYPVVGDSLAFIRHIDRELQQHSMQLSDTLPMRREWLGEIVQQAPKTFMADSRTSSEIPIHPARVITELRNVMPRNTILTVDTGSHAFFTSHYWDSYAPREFLSSIRYVGAMGWAIGAGIGAKCARPDVPSVVVTGDGCMLMHGMEVQTAARYGLDIIFVVINNSALGNPYLRARRISEQFAAMLTLPNHNFAMLATALGAKGSRVTDPEQLASTFAKALAEGGTHVIDVICGNYPTPTEDYDRSLHKPAPGTT